MTAKDALARAEPAPLRVQLIGRFGLRNAGGRELELKSRRARALLAYLMLEPRRSEERGRLAGLLWSDRAEPQARASLRQCLTELRAAMPADCVGINRETVSLLDHALTSDVAELDQALDANRIHDVVDRLHAIKDASLLRDLEVPGLFGEWLEQAREHFERRLAVRVRAVLATAQTRQAWGDVRALAQAQLLRDPLDEVVAAALMRAEAALGNLSAARRHYQSLSQALERAFGVEPGEDVRAALAYAPGRAAEDADRVETTAVANAPPEPLDRFAPSLELPLVVVAAIENGRLRDGDLHLASAIRDEVIASLAAFRDFRVTTASAGLAAIDREVWAQRGASYILGGGLRSTEGGVRFTAQLMRAADQQVIWSERVDASVGILETVEHIVTQVVGAVSPTIDADLERRGATRSEGVYARYVAARAAAHAPKTWEAAQAAAAALEALIAEDPDFTLPYLPLARLYNTDFCLTRAGSSGPTERERAFALARRALAQDRGHIYAYTVVGWCYLRRGEWTAARAHFDQAMQLNPFHSDRVMECAFGYLCLGDVDHAETLLKRCLLLSPTPRDSYYADLALLEIVRGDPAQASRYLDLIAMPHIWDTLYRSVCSTLTGRPDARAAAAAWGRIAAIWPQDTPMTAEAVTRWAVADHPFAEPAMARRLCESVRQTLN